MPVNICGHVSNGSAVLDPLRRYAVVRRAVPGDDGERALRTSNLEAVRSGLRRADVAEGARVRYFPHVCWEPEVLAVHDHVERLVGTRSGEEWAGAQLLLRSTDHAASWPMVTDVDEVPPWGGGRGYREIAGVALSWSRVEGGCLQVWPGSHAGRAADHHVVEIGRGDVVLTVPQLAHCASQAGCDRVRCALYLRLLRSCPVTGE